MNQLDSDALVLGHRSRAGEINTITQLGLGEFTANRLAGIPADAIKLEVTTDGGENWTEQELTDADVNNLTLIYGSAIKIGNGIENDDSIKATLNDKMRITLLPHGKNNDKNYFYTTIQKLLIYISTRGASGCKVLAEGVIQTNDLTVEDEWIEL